MPLITPALCHNDVDSDCCFASLLNGARQQSMTQNGVDLVFNPDDVLRDFLTETDWTGPPSADPGANPVSVIGWVMQTGLNVGQQVPLVIRSATPLAATDRQAIAQAVTDLGWAWVTLSLAAGDWDLAEPCSHQVTLVGVAGLADADALTFGTWDRLETQDWAWAAARIVAIRRVEFVLPTPGSV